jgi:hypothetical protein
MHYSLLPSDSHCSNAVMKYQPDSDGVFSLSLYEPAQKYYRVRKRAVTFAGTMSQKHGQVPKLFDLRRHDRVVACIAQV